jgi:hypothetical protein
MRPNRRAVEALGESAVASRDVAGKTGGTQDFRLLGSLVILTGRPSAFGLVTTMGASCMGWRVEVCPLACFMRSPVLPLTRSSCVRNRIGLGLVPPAHQSRVLKEETSMTKVHHLSALIAVSALLALSACGNNNTQAQAAPVAAPPPPAPAPAPAPAPPPMPAVAPSPTPHLIRQVQTVLRNAGDYHLAVDGRDGPATHLALRRWQHAHNIRPTGIIDSDTLQSMNIQ